jgi:cell division protein FtsW
VFCVAALMALGTVVLYAMRYASPAMPHYISQQTLWEVIGLAACVCAMMFDYRRLKKFSWLIYIVGLLALAAVFLPEIGLKRNGARRWLNVGFGTFQPSELAKLVLIIVLAHYTEHFQRKMPQFVKGMLIPGAIIAPILGLVFLEPDYGTTLLLAAVSAVMLVIGGVKLRVLVPVALIGLTAVGFSIAKNENRMTRVVAFLNPDQHREGKGFQQYQATIALGSGGLTGVGLGDGRQKYGYVPENHTDFILSIIGEELGLIATLGVVLAFLGIGLSGVYIASHACDRFGMMLATGITFLITLQAFINIGVVTMVLPNKGLPLPFVSYGGSSLLIMMTCVGVMLSVARHAHEPVKQERRSNPFNPRQVPSTQLP